MKVQKELRLDSFKHQDKEILLWILPLIFGQFMRMLENHTQHANHTTPNRQPSRAVHLPGWDPSEISMGVCDVSCPSKGVSVREGRE